MPIKDHNPSEKIPLITLALIAANVYMFVQELLSPNLEDFILRLALIPSQIDLSNPTTLTPFVTSMFVHGGFLHLLSNMIFLWVFGDNVEAKLGKIRFILFYFSTGILASLVQIFLIGASSTPMIGASGAIAGVLGAYVVMFPHARVDVLIPTVFIIPIIIALPAQLMIFYWFFTQLVSGVGSLALETASIGGVAFWAHIGGFLAGYLGIKFSQRKIG